jgi:hypothetical protein
MMMKALLKTTSVVVVLAVVCTVTVRADETKAPPTPEALLKALADAGKPTPEHKKLDTLIGHWNYTIKFWTDPSQPPAELTATGERKWIMDGRFVFESVRGQCPKTGKTIEGLGLLGYDAAAKKYTCVKACGLTGKIVSHEVSGDGSRFECATEDRCPLSGQLVKGRDEVVIESPDRIVVTQFKTINGRETKVGEIVQTRQK